MELNVILYIVFSVIFALIAFSVIRYIMKNKKLDRLHGITSENKQERREKAAQERAEKVTQKQELRAAIKAKKAEWKAEDKANDEQVKANIEVLKKEVAESQVKYDELKEAENIIKNAKQYVKEHYMAA